VQLICALFFFPATSPRNWSDCTLIRRGARGEVYKGVTDPHVAAKTIYKEYITDDRLLAEVALASTLGHENIMKIRSVGECQDKKRWVLFMELAKRGDLLRFLRENKSLSAENRLKLALGVARGMHYLHSRSAPLACDLRMHHVLVMGDNAPRLTKFVALPPGRERNERLKEDIFGFGKLLWELFTGQLPTADPRDTIEWWATSADNRPSLDDKRITHLQHGERLERLIGQCWLQDVYARPSADHVVRELEAIVADLEWRSLNLKRLVTGAQFAFIGLLASLCLYGVVKFIVLPWIYYILVGAGAVMVGMCLKRLAEVPSNRCDPSRSRNRWQLPFWRDKSEEKPKPPVPELRVKEEKKPSVSITSDDAKKVLGTGLVILLLVIPLLLKK
jgi:hypothetical protein